MVYACTVPGDFRSYGVDGAVMAIHAVDFGLGFCSKLLPGAIYNLFFDSVGTVKTSVYLVILLIGFFAVLSLLLEKFILSVELQHRKTTLIILAFFLTGPSTFAIHIYYPGMLDMYWVFCALLFFIFLTKKRLRPLLILPFLLCITIYFASLISFIPFFVIIMLYEISVSDTKKDKIQLWSILIISAVAAVALGIYLATSESNNLVYTIEEFREIYSKKGIDNFLYYEKSLYKFSDDDHLKHYFLDYYKLESKSSPILYEISAIIDYHLSKTTIKDKLVVFALIMPITVSIFAFLFNQIKYNLKNKRILKAFSNICMVALPFFTIIISVFFSEDLIRWISHAFLTLFASFIYILYNENEKAWKWVEERVQKLPFAVILLYLTFYATTIYHPYYIG